MKEILELELLLREVEGLPEQEVEQRLAEYQKRKEEIKQEGMPQVQTPERGQAQATACSAKAIAPSTPACEPNAGGTMYSSICSRICGS